MKINFAGLRAVEGMADQLQPLADLIEEKINLNGVVNNEKRIAVAKNKIMRICLIAGLYTAEQRNMLDIEKAKNSANGARLNSLFSQSESQNYFEAMLKLRYKDCVVNWSDSSTVSRIVAYEMLRGKEYLMDETHLNTFLFHEPAHTKRGTAIPALDLIIGDYGTEEMETCLRLNSRKVPNSQVLIAGATGSGKTNLLAVIINQFRQLSVETPYPVNFLLFDYKGEFSDPANNSWLTLFEVNRSCILNPVEKPLPFTPFKDFTGKSINEITLYSTEMAGALCSLDATNIGANMNNRLCESIIDAYTATKGKPIDFKLLLTTYQSKMPRSDKDDSVSSVLKQLVRSNLFEHEDKVNLVENCFIVKMDKFPKDGVVAKAIVYFIISKLNILYEQLEPQATTDDYVQIRHFTIIDEAHYMLDFDNRPLRNLIAVGRNKGLSIILATQNMGSYKSRHFDFYANAQYPLIMKQQTINNPVIKDLYGANNKELSEIRSAIAGLNLGELIIKDSSAFELGIGKKYKKVRVSRVI